MPPKKKKKVASKQAVESRVNSEDRSSEPSLLQRLQTELESNQSYVSLLLGLLIVLVVGVLVFNYFKKDADIATDQAADQQNQQPTQGQGQDVNPENLPGKYTVKQGDSLFMVAEKYYKDGYLYTEIVNAIN